jgi:hypothetical protein
MQELRNKITVLSNENNLLTSTSKVDQFVHENYLLTSKVDQFVQKQREHEAAQVRRRKCDRDNERAVCRTFGWKLNPTLLRTRGMRLLECNCRVCGV